MKSEPHRHTEKWQTLLEQRWDKDTLEKAGSGEDNKLLSEVMEFFFVSERGEARPSKVFRRLHNCILNAKVNSLQELADMGSRYFRGIKNSGDLTVRAAREMLSFYGLNFSNEGYNALVNIGRLRPEIVSLVPIVLSPESCRALIAAGITTIEQLKALREIDYLELCRSVLINEFKLTQQL